MKAPDRSLPAIRQLREIMSILRSPQGCPWDREQDHASLRFLAVEEVYELIDAIDAGDDQAMAEELGDVLLQVVFHCQLGEESRRFDFESVCQGIVDKLIHRHPHVFGDRSASTVDAVLDQWEKLKSREKESRISPLDGIPRHLPALQYAEKLVGKALKHGLLDSEPPPVDPGALGKQLFELAQAARKHGLSAEALLREENQRRERLYREKAAPPSA